MLSAMKVTIALRDDALYRAVRIRAAESGRQIRDVVEEALREWLERREDVEDLALGREALALRGVILALAAEPHPPGSTKLAGSDLWRVRVRVDNVHWRVVYQLREAERLVVVARVARRDEATHRHL